MEFEKFMILIVIIGLIVSGLIKNRPKLKAKLPPFLVLILEFFEKIFKNNHYRKNYSGYSGRQNKEISTIENIETAGLKNFLKKKEKQKESPKDLIKKIKNGWYIESEFDINNIYKEQGPYTNKQIKSMLSAGNISLDTYVWKPGFAEWYPLNKVENLLEKTVREKKQDKEKEEKNEFKKCDINQHDFKYNLNKNPFMDSEKFNFDIDMIFNK